MLLLDAGVWVAAGAPAERYHSSAGSLVRNRRREIAALDLTLYEVANTVAIKHAQPAEARKLLRAIRTSCRDDRLIKVDADLLDSALDVAAEHGLTAYDAAYVAAAGRYGWDLVSTDIRDLVSKGLAVTPDAADYP